MQPMVLVVGEDPGIREALAECIASLGVEVATAGDADEGLRRLAEEPTPAAVLLDPRLGGAGAEGFLEGMRGDPRLAEVPVVSVAGGAAGEELHARVEKPFDLHEIARILAPLCTPS